MFLRIMAPTTNLNWILALKDQVLNKQYCRPLDLKPNRIISRHSILLDSLLWDSPRLILLNGNQVITANREKEFKISLWMSLSSQQ